MYINHYTVSVNLSYPIVSFHGLALPPSALFLGDAAAMGGVCLRGLWVKVCLSGPAERNEKEDISTSQICAETESTC